MDSTLALGAFRIARGAGGEAVDVNGSLVEREKGDEFGIETTASRSTMACGRQKVKGGHGSITASISTSIIASVIASVIASIITLNLGVGCAPSCWPVFGFRTSWVLGGGAEGSFLCSPSSRFSGGGGGVGSLPRAWRRVGVPGAAGAKKIVRLASVFPSPPFGLPTSQGRGGLGSMDSTLALGAFRIARDAGGEAGRERGPRRAGEGRRVELNYRFLIHYLLFA